MEAVRTDVEGRKLGFLHEEMPLVNATMNRQLVEQATRSSNQAPRCYGLLVNGRYHHIS